MRDPRSTGRAAPEHVPTHHGRADVRLRLLDDGIAGVDLATLLALLLSPRLKLEDALVQIHTADAERVLHALVRAGNVSVQ
jgi:hypothetical protein